jgi:hypothetical protein
MIAMSIIFIQTRLLIVGIRTFMVLESPEVAMNSKCWNWKATILQMRKLICSKAT